MCCLAFKLRLLIAPFGIFKHFLLFFFWLLCCQAFKLRLLIALFGIFKLLLSFFFSWLCCLAFKLRLLITPLASSSFSCPFSFGYCVVWPSNYGFWLPLWRLQAFLVLFHLVIVLSGLQITASDYLFGVFKLFLSFFFWLLCCLAFKLRLLIAPFGIFKLFLSFFFWLLCCQAFKLRLLIALFGIFKLLLSFFFWLLCCLAFKLRLLITPLASSSFSCPFSFGYCVVWPSNYGFWLPLWRLQAFLVLFHLVIVLSGLHITASDYPFVVFKLFLSFFFWLLCCLAFKWRLLIAPFGIFKLFLSFFFWLLCCLAFKLRLLIISLASSSFSCPFSFGYCVVWPSNYGFWLPLWHLQTFLILFLLVIVLSGLQKYGFWLPLWRLQAFLVLFRSVIVLSGLQITASDYPFGVFKLFLSFFFWLLCCLAFKLRLLIIPLASSSFSCPFSFGYFVVWPSNYAYVYPFGIFKLFLLFFF